MPVQDLFMLSDLPSLNSSPDSVRNAFKSVFDNITPDGISVNSETYFNAVKPAITERYGQPCYKTLGKFSFTKGSSASPTSVVVGKNIVINYGDEVATMTLDVQGSWQNEQTWSSESTTGLTISSSFTIEGFFESGIEFSVGVSTIIKGTAESTIFISTIFVLIFAPESFCSFA